MPSPQDHRPPLPKAPRHHLPRPALVEALLREDCRLRLLVGPAGSGKSTLLSDCARQADAPQVLWLSLRGRALDGEALATLLFEALTAAQYRDEQSLHAHLLDRREPLWIMLDDPPHEAGKTLERLLALPCPQVRWWIGARRRPVCNLPRLLIENELFELDASALAFTQDELKSLLASQGRDSDADSVRRLHEETQGWCAAVSIQLLAAKPQAPLPPLPGNDMFLEYLQRELLDDLPEPLAAGMPLLASIASFDAGLCAQLLGGDGATWIKELKSHGLLSQLASTGKEWHYIPPAIARPLANQLSAEQAQALHRQACAWLESQGELRLAIDHALKSDQPEEAANLLERLYRQMQNSDLLHGRMVGKCLEWSRELPASLLYGTPTLVILNALIQGLALRPEEGQAALARLDHFLPAPSRKSQVRLIASAQVVRAVLAHAQGHLSLAREHCLQALPELAPRDWALRQACWYILSQQHLFAGELAQAEAVIQEGLKSARTAGVITVETLAELFQADLFEARGELSAALQLLDWRREQIRSSPYRATGITGQLNIRRGQLLLRCGQLDAARECLVEGYPVALHTHDPIAFQALVHLARIAALDGDPIRAGSLLLEAERLAQSRQIAEAAYRSIIDTGTARLLIQQGAHARAEALLARVIARHQGPHAIYQPYADTGVLAECTRLLALAQVAQGRQQQAQDLLENALATARQRGLRAEECEILLTLARITGASQARVWLQQGLAMAEAMQLHLPVETLRRSNPELFAGAAEQSVTGPLSARETEVLRLVAEGHSNHEIGERLFISVYTVKSHIQTLSGKLGVKRRTQAVARAKALGLLQ